MTGTEAEGVARLDEQLSKVVGYVPDWPIRGVPFTDVSPVWERRPDLFRAMVDRLCERHERLDSPALVAIEARAFLFAGAIAQQLGCRVVMARKGPRLPREVVTQEFGSGYESGLVMGIHRDAIDPEEPVVVLDDVLAMGWSVVGAVRLVEKMGARCAGVSVAIELGHLPGRQNVKEYAGKGLFAAARTPENWGG